jgi:hypothetical protein
MSSEGKHAAPPFQEMSNLYFLPSSATSTERIMISCGIQQKGKLLFLSTRIVDRHRLDADPDPAFLVDADAYPDPS